MRKNRPSGAIVAASSTLLLCTACNLFNPPAAQNLPIDPNSILLVLVNQSGVPVSADAVFLASGSQVRSTTRYLDPAGIESSIEALPTVADTLMIVARETTPRNGKVNDVLLQKTLTIGVDFVGGDTVEIDIPPESGPVMENLPPVANAGGNQTILSGANFSLDGSQSHDPNGDTLTFQWTQTAGPNVNLSNAKSATPSATAPIVAAGQSVVLTFSLVVTDPSSATGTATVNVTVNGPGVIQVGASAAPNPVSTGGVVTLSSTVSGGIAPYQYQWTVMAPAGRGPGNLTESTNPTAHWVSSPGEAGTWTFTLTVHDAQNNSGTGTTTVVVTADCNTNGTNDANELTGHDCNTNGVPDECDLAGGLDHDCNSNGTLDACDVAAGATDCNSNGYPDECESSADCNDNGTADICDIAAGAMDCDTNGVPDECEAFADCNTNGTLDTCDITVNGLGDCNGDATPDECQLGDVIQQFSQPGLEIDDDSFVTDSMHICNDGVVADVNVKINIAHTFDGDLIVTLKKNQYASTLTNRDGGSNENFTNTVFDDQANNPISDINNGGGGGGGGGLGSSAPYSDTFRPETPLSVFNGLSAKGRWCLRVSDEAGGDTGTLICWSLEIHTAGLDCNTDGTIDSCQNLTDCDTNGTPDVCEVGTQSLNQWASSVIGFSTEYSNPDWSAAQVLGQPNTFDYGDEDTAWAPSMQDGTLEYVTVGYQTPVFATGAVIRETLGNGMVYQVDVLDTQDVLHTVWQGTDPSQPGAPADFQLSWAPTAYLVKGLKVYTNTDHSTDWEELDAIQLLGELPRNGDCNTNGVPDVCDIASGAADCDTNGMPDLCEVDCDTNGTPDVCDLSAGAPDCNSNGKPDACDLTVDRVYLQQLPDQDTAFPSEADCADCPIGSGSGAESAATAFFTDAPQHVIRIKLWGFYFDNNVPNPVDDFTVVLHTFGKGYPGPAILTLDHVPSTHSQTGQQIFGFDEYEFDLTPTGGIDLGVDAYYIEIFNHSVPGTHFAWETGTTDGAHGILAVAFAASAPGSNWEILGDEFSLSLELDVGGTDDCNTNGIPDECDIANGLASDCDTNGVPDTCETDCNTNGIADICDTGVGSSVDCDTNGIPDECEADCNTNGQADVCDTGYDSATDCDTNGTPDECETDCNTNGTADLCDTAFNSAGDCDTNGIPDECEAAFTVDCNTNGTPDICDATSGCATDCDTNGTLDVCDIAAGAADCDSNGMLDACDLNPFGRAISGSGQQVIMAQLDVSETDYTASLWFKTTDPNCGLFSVDSGFLGNNGHDRHIYLSNGDLATRVWSDETIRTSGTNFADGQWHQVLHTFGGCVGGQRIYVDGQLRAQGSMSLSNFDTQDGINIGFSNDAQNQFFSGEIDDVRIWSKALKDREILENYNRFAPPKRYQLIAWYKLDEPAGVQVARNSVGHNNGTDGVLGFGPTVDNADPARILSTVPISPGVDCNTNGTIDSCEGLADCNTNGIADVCELLAGGDCDTDGTPDVCQSGDCNTNGTPDRCELGGDCNNDGTLDACEDLGTRAGRAVSFDGQDDYISADLGSSLGSNYTISAWIKLRTPGDAGGNRAAILSNPCDAGAEFLIHDDGSTQGGPQYLELGRCNEYNGVLSTLAVPLNTWTHVAVSVDASKQISYFVNGQAAGTWDASAFDVTIPQVIYLGQNGQSGRLFDGEMFDYAIWNAARTGSELQQQMNGGLTGSEPGLLAYWKFDEGFGLTAHDSAAAGGANDGTLFNGTAWVTLLTDCNTNGTPDVCEADCNTDGTPDSCELSGAFSGSVSPNLDIFDNATTNSDLVVSGVAGAVSGVTVGVNITHTYDSDLNIALLNGSTLVQLSFGNGPQGAGYLGTVFDDNAAISITDTDNAAPPYAGTFQPQTPLSNFNGKQASGTWTLQVGDTADEDTGTLLSWSLVLRTTGLDCNTNGVPDACDIASSVSADCNADGTPDECQFHFASLTASDQPNLIINDNTLQSAQIAVTAGSAGVVTDVNVGLNIVHTYDSDLVIQLEKDGRSALLSANNGRNGFGYLGTVFDDQAGIAITDTNNAFPPFSGAFQPQQPLSRLNGVAVAGVWTLNVTDTADEDTGTLLSWSLVISGSGGDCNTDGTLDACEGLADCNTNSVPDVCENVLDCNTDGTLDICEGPGADCNTNGTSDACDITGGTSRDCNADGVPDECDTFFGHSADCNTDSTPDECEIVDHDCNTNGVPDDCDIGSSGGVDCDTNGIPDECEVAQGDCNTNGTPDICDIGAPAPVSFPITPLLPINDLQQTDSALAVTETRLIRDVDVDVEIQHTRTSDLRLTLDGPSITSVLLAANVGSGANFFGTIFDDSAATPITAGSSPFTGRFQPQDSLSVFNGSDPSGTWQLHVSDQASGETGTLISWTLILHTDGAGDCNTNGVPDECDIRSGNSMDADTNGVPDECVPS